MDTESILDTSALDNIRALQQPGTEDLVTKIVSMFLEDSEKYGSEIGQAIEDSDTGRLGAAAHSLKSCAANVGAMQVSAIAARLELLGRNDTLTNADTEFEDLRGALTSVRGRLVSMLHS